MFTGIIQAVGEISAIDALHGDSRLQVDSGGLELASIRLGDSIAVNGVCLTVIDLGPKVFTADVSQETLGLTTLGELKISSSVNLEPSLSLASSLGGHLVSGHVDGVAEIVSLQPDARSTRMAFAVPPALARYIARKGSITLDGISLTVNDISAEKIFVNIGSSFSSEESSLSSIAF